MQKGNTNISQICYKTQDSILPEPDLKSVTVSCKTYVALVQVFFKTFVCLHPNATTAVDPCLLVRDYQCCLLLTKITLFSPKNAIETENI